ncbi:MAG: shikimate kinase [Acidobacteriota bacterium]
MAYQTLRQPGYYDHHPTVRLDRHFVIAGYFVQETRQIGYQVAALTGLGVSDLDRKIEHHVGCSIQELLREQGEERYRALECRWLGRLLGESPPGIITLGDGALIDAANRKQVLRNAELVALDLDLPNCYWRVQQNQTDDSADWHPLYPGPILSWEQIRPFHELRRPGFAEAHHRIDIRGKARAELVEQLMGLLGG